MNLRQINIFRRIFPVFLYDLSFCMICRSGLLLAAVPLQPHRHQANQRHAQSQQQHPAADPFLKFRDGLEGFCERCAQQRLDGVIGQLLAADPSPSSVFLCGCGQSIEPLRDQAVPVELGTQ